MSAKERLLEQSKEELAELLLLSLQGQQQMMENMQTLVKTMEASAARIKELEDQLSSCEAELIMLRNRP